MRIATGDPASVSSLASELARLSGRLAERHTDLLRTRDQLVDWRGPSADAFAMSQATLMRVVADVSAALAACGRALQEYAVELQQARAAAAEAEDWCTRHGLAINEGLVVTMPWGPYPVQEAQAYADLVPRGQQLVDRVREQAEDAAVRVQRRTADHVQAMAAAGYAATAAVQTARYSVQLGRAG